MARETNATTEVRLRGRAATLARVAWLAWFIFSLAVFTTAVPARYAQLVSPEDEIRDGLARQGYSETYIAQYGSEAALREILIQVDLSPRAYAAYEVALEAGIALLCILVALVIFWNKADTRMGWFASLFLVTLGMGSGSYLLVPLGVQSALGFYLVGVVSTVAYTLQPLFFYLFPSGRLVPRWAWIPAGLWVVTTFFWNFAPRSPLNPTYWPVGLYLLYVIAVWGGSVLAQFYRYRRVSSALERQQTKWLVYGFASLVGLVVPLGLAPIALGSDLGTLFAILTPLQTLGFAIIPLALAVSILRYRLWDIDLIIRRTLIYSVLTALLALLYFGSVVVIQGLLRGLTGSESPLVIVLSTLIIAALFVPLRARVQAAIDRRFYRRKYDAARTLAAFAASARDETDLAKLSDQLQQTVQDTMQPVSVGLWLKPSQRTEH